jgi:hypothetical protein
MGLDLLPRSTSASSAQFSPGMTHLEDQPCPFSKDDNPHGVLATCCSFRGNPLAVYLLAMGLAPVAFDLYEDKKTAEDTIAFGEALRKLAIDMQSTFTKLQQRAGRDPSPSDEAVIEVPGLDWKFPVANLIEALEAASDWYEKVGRMGFGVKAWF